VRVLSFFYNCEDEGSKSSLIRHRVDFQLGSDVLGTLAVSFVRVEADQEIFLGYQITPTPAIWCTDTTQYNTASEL